MTFVDATIRGMPYPKNKAPSKAAAEKWSAEVTYQTRDVPRIKEACAADITFFLPPSRFSDDVPNGPDLDNLLKRFLDALNETVFSEAKRKDSCIVELSARKVRVDSEEEGIGARIQIKPVSLDISSRMEK